MITLEWKSKFKDYIDLLMVREAPPPDRLCSVCNKDECINAWLFHEPLFCTDCCRAQHPKTSIPSHQSMDRFLFSRNFLAKVGCKFISVMAALHVHPALTMI